MSEHAKSDPAHPSHANENHTMKSGEKPSSAFEAVTDTDFLPSLDDAPMQQKAKSHGLLVFLVLGAVVGCWLLGFDLFQVRQDRSWVELGLTLGAVAAVILGLLVWIGTASVDLWSLVMEWGWYSLPVVGAMGLLFVVMQERTEEMGEVS